MTSSHSAEVYSCVLDRDPRIVEADVEPAVLGRDLVDDVVDVGLVANVRPHVGRFSARRTDLLLDLGTASPCARQKPTLPPSAANRIAAARPIPEVAPVMTSTLFSNRRLADGAIRGVGVPPWTKATPPAMPANAPTRAATPPVVSVRRRLKRLPGPVSSFPVMR
jgi:hypothetical protein